MQTIICDICKKPIEKGKRYKIELKKIHKIEDAVTSYDNLGEHDACQKCFLSVEREVRRIQKIANQK